MSYNRKTFKSYAFNLRRHRNKENEMRRNENIIKKYAHESKSLIDKSEPAVH